MALADRLTLSEKLMLVGVVVLLIAGCGLAVQAGPGSGAELTALTLADDGKTFELAVGQTLTLELEANPTTGYGWEVVETGGGILEQVGEPIFQQTAARGQALGADGVQILAFKAVGRGEGLLELVYRRPWEKDADPLSIFTIKVLVR